MSAYIKKRMEKHNKNMLINNPIVLLRVNIMSNLVKCYCARKMNSENLS